MSSTALKAAALGMCICPPALFVAGTAVKHHEAPKEKPAIARTVERKPRPLTACLILREPDLAYPALDVMHTLETVDLPRTVYTPPGVTGGGGEPTHPAPEPPMWAIFLAGLSAIGMFRVRL